MGSHVCATTALNPVILDEKLGHYKCYQSLISRRKCVIVEVRPPRGVDCGVTYHLEKGRLRFINVRL